MFFSPHRALIVDRLQPRQHDELCGNHITGLPSTGGRSDAQERARCYWHLLRGSSCAREAAATRGVHDDRAAGSGPPRNSDLQFQLRRRRLRRHLRRCCCCCCCCCCVAFCRSSCSSRAIKVQGDVHSKRRLGASHTATGGGGGLCRRQRPLLGEHQPAGLRPLHCRRDVLRDVEREAASTERAFLSFPYVCPEPVLAK